jgi:hypothetical protein
MSNPWRSSAEFDLAHYPAPVQAAIIRTRYASERLRRCSVCGKKRVVWGVVCHPGLKAVEVPPGLTPRCYALCVAHRGMTVEEIGAVVYGAAWGQAGPEQET